MVDTKSVVAAWRSYINSIEDWKSLVEGIAPKQTDCGPVYELENPIDRPNESFAIVDMRNVELARPHYHANGEVEIYFILEGSGITVVGSQEHKDEKGAVIVTPPNVVHYTVPSKGLVLAAVNTPAFRPENVMWVDETNPKVGFDKTQLERLLHGHKT